MNIFPVEFTYLINLLAIRRKTWQICIFYLYVSWFLPFILWRIVYWLVYNKMQTAVLSGGNASAHYSGLPLRGCYRRLDFELVACCCVILLLAPSVIILVYDYYKVGDSLYKTPFLTPDQCRNISVGPISIVKLPPGKNATCISNLRSCWNHGIWHLGFPNLVRGFQIYILMKSCDLKCLCSKVSWNCCSTLHICRCSCYYDYKVPTITV